MTVTIPDLTIRRSIMLTALSAALFLTHVGPASLIAHDEGLYATRALLMLDRLDFIHPFATPHHKPPDYYWFLAAVFGAFGRSEFVGRLPSGIAGVAIVLLTYSIGRRLIGPTAAFLGAMSLAVMPFFFHTIRIISLDPFLVLLVLASLLLLLQATEDDRRRRLLSFAAGLLAGLVLIVRGPALIAPAIALGPFLIPMLRRRRIDGTALAGGLFLGATPLLLWLALCFFQNGINVAASMSVFSATLATTTRADNGPLLYVWNIALNTAPWSVFAILGAVALLRERSPFPARAILIGAPAIGFVALSLFSTRLPHYAVWLYPFIALLAGKGLGWAAVMAAEDPRWRSTRQRVAGLLMLFLGVLIGAAAMLLVSGSIDLTLGPDGPSAASLASVGFVFSFALTMGGAASTFAAPLRLSLPLRGDALAGWFLGLLGGAWLAGVTAAFVGVVGDPNPQMRRLASDPHVASVLAMQTVNKGPLTEKTAVLATFATPHLGLTAANWQDLASARGYAWISSEDLIAAGPRAIVLAKADRNMVAFVRWMPER